MAGIYPFFHPLESSEGSVVQLEGKDIIMLGSNNYLGLTHHPKVLAAAKQAINDFGTSCTGSRFLNGNLKLHLKLEENLANFFGYEQALVFSAAFLANIGVLDTLGKHQDAIIFSEKENHASLIDGARLAPCEVRLFEDPDDLEKQLSKQENWSNALVVIDAVFSMTGRIAKLKEFAALRRQYGFRLYVDDAHGIGVFGPQGRGTIFEQGVQQDVDLLFGTFSKALASVGGFVAGEKMVIDYLRHKTRSLIFTAGLPPASAAAALAALQVMQKEADEILPKIRENARYWKQGLDEIGYYTMDSVSQIIPTMIGSESLAFRIARDLLDMGVFAIPVPYPVVPCGQSLIRTSVMPTHTKEHLDKALDAFSIIYKRYSIPKFDPDNLPVADKEDWSYFMPQKTN
ncbi:serine palmitoyltransferase-like [Ylistrum balloti]|uniref:serine palmitoyltransferase-like n=1 Tax=Ylistrum balloti TaxID=509963 RepID=UPI0029058D20|nr:serine palmitoyltransferase-like [Ylistrum balloti]